MQNLYKYLTLPKKLIFYEPRFSNMYFKLFCHKERVYVHSPLQCISITKTPFKAAIFLYAVQHLVPVKHIFRMILSFIVEIGILYRRWVNSLPFLIHLEKLRELTLLLHKIPIHSGEWYFIQKKGQLPWKQQSTMPKVDIKLCNLTITIRLYMITNHCTITINWYFILEEGQLP